VEDANETIAVMQRAFYKVGLQSAWERVVGIVVQPGVEFGDDFIMDYDPRLSIELSKFIESKSMVYEAHSTDYQRRDSLKALVKDHFAILKVGPALTFAFRQAIFALAFIENELSPIGKTSNILQVLDQEMLNRPEVWGKYHAQDQGALAYKRKYSLSDRLRYFWTSDLVKNTIDMLLYNLNMESMPLSLISQFAPIQYTKIRAKEIDRSPEAIIRDHIQSVLLDYEEACE
jgi:D-tagatose-1,6-bisphosphate aldolase subunit GatZ/KbaZ